MWRIEAFVGRQWQWLIKTVDGLPVWTPNPREARVFNTRREAEQAQAQIGTLTFLREVDPAPTGIEEGRAKAIRELRILARDYPGWRETATRAIEALRAQAPVEAEQATAPVEATDEDPHVVVCLESLPGHWRITPGDAQGYVLATRQVFPNAEQASEYASTVHPSRQPLVAGGDWWHLRNAGPS